MIEVIQDELAAEVNVPAGNMVQFTSALGAAYLGQRRLARLAEGVGAGA